MAAVKLLTFIAVAIFNANAGYIAFPREKCYAGEKILNDCNWCRCTQGEFICERRNCKAVDMFGYFNDAIKDIDVGMEGHGVWRSVETPCEPNVHYRRGPLLCVCDENGQWPNPTCRDTFQVLHPVETTGSQDSICMPTKLYLQECNVCYCPEAGRLDPKLCTKKKCQLGDPVLQQLDITNEEIQDAYASCEPDKKYNLGCQMCTCLRDNKLICANCTTEKEQHYCNFISPHVIFNVECNMCFCNKEGRMICTVKQCVEPTTNTVTDIDERYFELIDHPTELHKCRPGTKYRKGCNTCVCMVGTNGPMFACSTRLCKNETLMSTIREGCVLNTSYELNCLQCSCTMINGEPWQLCETENLCSDSKSDTTELSSMHGYCEPLHTYWKECNSCQCFSDGQLVICSDKKCSQAVISLEIVPMLHHRTDCPRGSAYKIDCNICYCLKNGNSLCTTFECDKQ